MRRFSMLEVISILGLPMPRNGRSSYNISCPYCDTKPKQKHLNINLKKEVYRCPKCGEHGGIFDLYSLFSGVPRDKVLDDLINRTEPHEKTEHKPKYIGSVDIPDLESPLADIETRHLVYSSLLSKLTLASDHKNTDAFRRLVKKNKMRHIRFHDLRHTCASLLLNKGKGKVTMKDIQEWLGHSDYKTTANIYAHLDLSSKYSSLETLDSIIEI